MSAGDQVRQLADFVEQNFPLVEGESVTEAAIRIMKGMKAQIFAIRATERTTATPSEILYGFGAWLTSRPTVLTASSNHPAGDMAEVIDAFIKANNIRPPRNGWTDKVKWPPVE